MIKLNRKGQNTLEYVLLITCVVVAFIAVQHYLNRGIQGRVREASDNIGSQFDAEVTTATYETSRTSRQQDTTIPSGHPEGGNITTSTLLENEITSRDATENVPAPVIP
ncbi:MAG: hypothetical protein JW869_06120 [Candidatus Omnitrophica bacterium]|nr:hypothetical protein [Candidatus Omnitrophota bacterium]